MTYNHPEAFNLMRYASEDATVQELLWNSRDGATPFCVTAADEKTELQHVAWQNDIRISHYLPPIGMRIFVDLTPERALAFAKEWADIHWEQGLKTYYETKALAIESWIASLHSGEPDIVVVDYALQQQLLDRYKDSEDTIETRAPWDCYQFHYKTPVRFA